MLSLSLSLSIDRGFNLICDIIILIIFRFVKFYLIKEYFNSLQKKEINKNKLVPQNYEILNLQSNSSSNTLSFFVLNFQMRKYDKCEMSCIYSDHEYFKRHFRFSALRGRKLRPSAIALTSLPNIYNVPEVDRRGKKRFDLMSVLFLTFHGKVSLCSLAILLLSANLRRALAWPVF